jgi:hypothetical protein
LLLEKFAATWRCEVLWLATPKESQSVGRADKKMKKFAQPDSAAVLGGGARPEPATGAVP